MTGGWKVCISAKRLWLEVLTAEYERTSLKPYVEMFEKHVAAVLRDARGAKKGELTCLLDGGGLTTSCKGGEYGFLREGSVVVYMQTITVYTHHASRYGAFYSLSVIAAMARERYVLQLTGGCSS
jgi:hypothetical protein